MASLNTLESLSAMVRLPRVPVLLWLLLAPACTPPTTTPKQTVLTIAEHDKWFPIGATAVHALNKQTKDGAIACESCHRSATLTDVTCIGCHHHPVDLVNGRDVNDTLHLDAPNYLTKVPSGADVIKKSDGCRSCHKDGRRLLAHFPHGGIEPGANSFCATCHDTDHPFDAFAVKRAETPAFTHVDTNGADCGGCHTTDTWKGASGVSTSNAFDPKRDLPVSALSPTYTGTSITRVTPDQQVLHMTMNHAARALDAGVLSACGNCHDQADQGSYYPGVLHWSLTNLGVPQPTTCGECHSGAIPRGFVGDLDARRDPASGGMKHDAVTWVNGVPTTTRLITADCSVCHQAPNDKIDATWQFAYGRDDAGADFHPSLRAAGRPQPDNCLDCHANSRPTTPVTTPNFVFDHSTALGSCFECHTSTTTWAGAKFHNTTAPTPTTCLPCHAATRPTSTTTWQSNFRASPFDYVTNAASVTHGNDEDCVTCHSGPGSGVWGSNQNWQRGAFTHTTTSSAGTTCINCHSTQRPDLLTPAADAGFNHAASGTGDCVGCHQATMTRNTFVNLMPIPGGDWREGQTYPGGTAISAPNQFVRLPSTTLTRTGATVTGMSTATVTLPNSFVHTSSAVPTAISPGPATNPNQGSCWHCHTSTGTTVSSYSNGKFHSALTNFRATPTSSVTALQQPSLCNDCHRTMRPPNIVSRLDAGTWLTPMDHSVSFTGSAVSGVPAMDCSSCHRTPGAGPTQWSDGKFHPNQPSSATFDCVGCHYPLMTLPAADVTSPSTSLPSTFTMKHRSTLVTTQACRTCHDTAFTNFMANLSAPVASTQFRTGAYHSILAATTQPASCTECHGASVPTSSTQGSVVYPLTQGGTATNGAQWMNHADTTVVGKDCNVCHLADAKVSGSAWSKAAPFHPKVATVTGCAKCHGLTNGRGTVAGTSNNLPAGLTDSLTITTSSAAAANTRDQVTHTDSNVTRFDCNFCHTQTGPSTAGKEWQKAAFHRNFTSANPLIVNGSTGRCSNCHMNVKPGAGYAKMDHAPFTATSTQDCASCHSWPGNSTTTPNWLGATGTPHATSGATATSALDCNTCHGQNGSSNVHLATAAANHFGGITNGNKCTSCHVNFAGFKGTVTNLKYGHTNSTANAPGCVSCHAFAAQLYTTLTTTPPLTYPTATGGHQFSQTRSVTGTKSGDSFTANHTNANLTRCGACHNYSTTTSSGDIWTFRHKPSNPGISNSKSSPGCNMCH